MQFLKCNNFTRLFAPERRRYAVILYCKNAPEWRITMKQATKTFYSKVVSLALAAVMVLSVLYVSLPVEVSAADRSFKSTGKSSVTIKDEECSYATGELTWIKFKAKSDGYLKITAKNASSLYSTAGAWQLYDKTKKNPVSPIHDYDTNETDYWYYTDVFGVKKGVTYYLAVKSYAGTTINAAFTKVADKSGSKKTKALNIKKNKETTGLVRVGDSKKSDWYKLNLSSVRKFTLYLTPYMCGDLTLTISGSKLDRTYSYSVKQTEFGEKLSFPFGANYGTISGTVYVKVTPAQKNSSGYYKLKWK